jgi:hypothetical protein
MARTTTTTGALTEAAAWLIRALRFEAMMANLRATQAQRIRTLTVPKTAAVQQDPAAA